MSTEFITNAQSKAEIRTHFCDYTNDLPAGVIVSTATATHVPPSGSASTPVVEVHTPQVWVTLGPLAAVGSHILNVIATLSDGEKSEILLRIPVVW